MLDGGLASDLVSVQTQGVCRSCLILLSRVGYRERPLHVLRVTEIIDYRLWPSWDASCRGLLLEGYHGTFYAGPAAADPSAL